MLPVLISFVCFTFSLALDLYLVERSSIEERDSDVLENEGGINILISYSIFSISKVCREKRIRGFSLFADVEHMNQANSFFYFLPSKSWTQRKMFFL